MSKYKDHECLKTRTIHVKGVLSNDRTGNGIERYLNDILRKRTFGVTLTNEFKFEMALKAPEIDNRIFRNELPTIIQKLGPRVNCWRMLC